MPAPLDEIERLRDEIRFHDRKYYVEAAPQITDLEYDRLMQRLVKLEEQHPELVAPDSPTQRVGEEPVEHLVQVEHRVPMLSIDNTYSIEELRKYGERIAKLLPDEPVEWVVELKIDGVAASVLYENGALVRGVTRGNGTVGDDITHNIRTVADVPLRLVGDPPPAMEVRGEVYMANSDLVALNERQQADDKPLYANTRNVTAGSIRLLDSRLCAQRRLRMFCHGVGHAEGLRATTHMEFLDELRGYGLPATPHVECLPSFDAAVDHCQELIERLHELDFEVDGLVLKVNRFDQREQLGVRSKSPRWIIAYKWEKYEAVTRLNHIRVQVGKTGTITPVAELEPVELAGTTVSRASLHNADEIERKDIREGDVVVVEKAGKIIPHIVRVEKHERKPGTKKFPFPTECPECHTPVVKDEGGVYIRCPNRDCPAQVRERIRYYASRNAMDVEGLGDKLVEQLVSLGMVRDYADIYRLSVDEVACLERADTWGEKVAATIVSGIESVKTKGLDWLLHALCSGELKRDVAEKLASTFRGLDFVLDANVAVIGRSLGVRAVIAERVFDTLHTNIRREIVADLRAAGVVTEDVSELRSNGDQQSLFPLSERTPLDREADKTKRRLRFFSKEIPGLGPVRVDQIVDEGLVVTFGDLFRLGVSDLITLERTVRMGELSANNLMDKIDKSKHRGLARLLNALSIRHVGENVAALLTREYGDMDELGKASPEDISSIPGIGDVIGKSVHDYLHGDYGRATILSLADEGVNMEAIAINEKRSDTLVGLTFAVTGTLSNFTRVEIKKTIAEHGGRATSTVSSNTDFVVAGENPGSKVEKARKIGVRVLTEDEFEALLER